MGATRLPDITPFAVAFDQVMVTNSGVKNGLVITGIPSVAQLTFMPLSAISMPNGTISTTTQTIHQFCKYSSPMYIGGFSHTGLYNKDGIVHYIF